MIARRRRAFAFLLAAALAAVTAGAVAQGYGDRVARGYGELRPVVVAGAGGLRAGRPIDPETATSGLEVRRVPLRFVPPGALERTAEALGLVPEAAVPEGSYLLAGQLRPPRRRRGPRLGGGRRPVEIAVSGAAALASAGAPLGAAVDVVVTTEPTGSGDGRTYVAAAGVPLLGLAPEPAGAEGAARATLGLTRRQALRLIQAESFARRVTVIGRP